jgi:hypothetical protein
VGWTAEWPLETDKVLYCGYWRSPFQALGPLFVSVPVLASSRGRSRSSSLAPFCLLPPGRCAAAPSLLDCAIALSCASLAVTFLWG